MTDTPTDPTDILVSDLRDFALDKSTNPAYPLMRSAATRIEQDAVRIAELKRQRDKARNERDEMLTQIMDTGFGPVEEIVDAIPRIAAERDAARAALREIASDPHQEFAGIEMYDIGVADGHRCAAAKAERALKEQA